MSMNAWERISAPTMRPDGTILQSFGEDPTKKTKLSFTPPDNVRYPDIKDKPTQAECEKELATILEAVRDFPFLKKNSASAWLAGLFTCIARPAIEGPTPLFLVTGEHGAGKSLLARLASIIAYGDDVGVMGPPADNDEMRKRITVALHSCERMAVLDNVWSMPYGDALASVLTAETWMDRVHGSSASVRLPARTVWWMTAQPNLSLSADLARRALHIQLGGLESPDAYEARDNFQHPNLRAWAARQRAPLVSSVLTILRGYVVADRPVKVRAWGSYEEWSSLISGAIQWVGLPNPVLARFGAKSSSDV